MGLVLNLGNRNVRCGPTHRRPLLRHVSFGKKQGGFDMPKSTLLAVICATFLSVSALAQTPAPEGTPTRIRGTVEKLDGQTLAVKSRDGQEIKITLAANYTVSALVKKSAADI